MKSFVIITSFFVFASAQTEPNGCWPFKKHYKDAEDLVQKRRQHEINLEEEGFVLNAGDLGFERSRNGLMCNQSNYWLSEDGKIADNLNTAARLFYERNPKAFADFSTNAKCLKRYPTEVKTRPKYRAIDGFGNNLKRPYMGTPYTPFGRQGPKNYDDGISSIRKSVTGSDLPSPRVLVIDVLNEADIKPRTVNNLTTFFILSNLYISHDQAHMSQVEPKDNCKEIRCCTSGNKKVLDPSLSHSACLPISIGKDDEFYGKSDIGCLNMVRTEAATSPTSIQYGEILNRVTAFTDHSMIYGSDEKENRRIRSFKGGKIFLGKNGILPANSNGKYTKISDRLTAVPIGAILPVLLARNHNNLAEEFAKINPKWTDEKLFQEARRLNIALFQHLFFHRHFFAATGTTLDFTYDKKADISPNVEFITGAYRFFHAFMNDFLPFVDSSGNLDSVPMSETFGKIDLIQNRFDDALRGVLSERMHFDGFSEELYNKFAKNSKGIGLDAISIDIQRCRDHGMPTYLEFRKFLGLSWNFTTFEDLLGIFSQKHVDLLKKVYADVRDIDLYVGGTLESFQIFDIDIVGETFGSIIVYQFEMLIRADSYYYTHADSPYPFTQAQINAINDYDYQNLICVNSGLEKVNQNWANPESASNPAVPCSNYPQIDLSAWTGI